MTMVQAGHSVFPNHGWLAVVSVLVLGYTLEPSVPRFNPGVVIPKTGGGYRLYLSISGLTISNLYELVRFDLGFPALFGIFLYRMLGHINSYEDGQECAPYIQPRG
ncbi:hypothetical protein ACN4EW_31820 [Arthrospira platensis CENA650]